MSRRNMRDLESFSFKKLSDLSGFTPFSRGSGEVRKPRLPVLGQNEREAWKTK